MRMLLTTGFHARLYVHAARPPKRLDTVYATKYGNPLLQRQSSHPLKPYMLAWALLVSRFCHAAWRHIGRVSAWDPTIVGPAE